MVSSLPRLAVLLSGRGSNLLALQAAIDRGELRARISLVLSNETNAPGLAKARSLGLDTICLPHREAGTRATHERRVLDELIHAGVEWVCLAGYMRLLSAAFLRSFPGRVVNVHPSLLPAFPGLEAQKRALEYGAKFTGCTVHLVDGGLDTGPIVAQRVVPIFTGDTLDLLADRILIQEHELYPASLQRLIGQRWNLVGRRLVFEEARLGSSADPGLEPSPTSNPRKLVVGG